MTDRHDRFMVWLVAGADGEPPRDLAIHASGCEVCGPAIAVMDSLAAIDVGAAAAPSLPMSLPRSSRVRAAPVVVAVLALATIGTSVAIGGFGLLSETPPTAGRPSPSTGEDVLAGVPTEPVATAEPSDEEPTPTPDESPSPSATQAPQATAEPTGAQVPPVLHQPPAPPPVLPPPATAAPTPRPATPRPPTPRPTSAPSPTPIPTAPPTPPPPPTPTATPTTPPPSASSPTN